MGFLSSLFRSRDALYAPTLGKLTKLLSWYLSTHFDSVRRFQEGEKSISPRYLLTLVFDSTPIFYHRWRSFSIHLKDKTQYSNRIQ